MKIVVLDGYTLNPGDLGWDELEALGECAVHGRTAPEDVLSRISGAEIVLTNKTVLDRRVIEEAPRLRYIGVLATGYNVVDLDAARDRGITVTNVPAYSTPSVAEMVFALLLELTRQVGRHAALVREGCWSRSPDFCFQDRPQIELAGLAFGVVGFGAIGRQVAKVAAAFDMSVLVHTRTPEKYPEEARPAGVRFVDLETLFAQSDVVSLHCPLTSATERLVDARRLSSMKPGAFLINTGRGPLLDEGAVADALKEGRLAGAGLDVLSVEPPREGNPLIGAPNCVVTPHIAWATRASRQRLMTTAAANVASFLGGGTQNVVN